MNAKGALSDSLATLRDTDPPPGLETSDMNELADLLADRTHTFFES